MPENHEESVRLTDDEIRAVIKDQSTSPAERSMARWGLAARLYADPTSRPEAVSLLQQTLDDAEAPKSQVAAARLRLAQLLQTTDEARSIGLYEEVLADDEIPAEWATLDHVHASARSGLAALLAKTDPVRSTVLLRENLKVEGIPAPLMQRSQFQLATLIRSSNPEECEQLLAALVDTEDVAPSLRADARARLAGLIVRRDFARAESLWEETINDPESTSRVGIQARLGLALESRSQNPTRAAQLFREALDHPDVWPAAIALCRSELSKLIAVDDPAEAERLLRGNIECRGLTDPLPGPVSLERWRIDGRRELLSLIKNQAHRADQGEQIISLSEDQLADPALVGEFDARVAALYTNLVIYRLEQGDRNGVATAWRRAVRDERCGDHTVSRSWSDSSVSTRVASGDPILFEELLEEAVDDESLAENTRRPLTLWLADWVRALEPDRAIEILEELAADPAIEPRQLIDTRVALAGLLADGSFDRANDLYLLNVQMREVPARSRHWSLACCARLRRALDPAWARELLLDALGNPDFSEAADWIRGTYVGMFAAAEPDRCAEMLRINEASEDAPLDHHMVAERKRFELKSSAQVASLRNRIDAMDIAPAERSRLRDEYADLMQEHDWAEVDHIRWEEMIDPRTKPEARAFARWTYAKRLVDRDRNAAMLALSRNLLDPEIDNLALVKSRGWLADLIMEDRTGLIVPARQGRPEQAIRLLESNLTDESCKDLDMVFTRRALAGLLAMQDRPRAEQVLLANLDDPSATEQERLAATGALARLAAEDPR